jgi:hypothetical protein
MNRIELTTIVFCACGRIERRKETTLFHVETHNFIAFIYDIISLIGFFNKILSIFIHLPRSDEIEIT